MFKVLGGVARLPFLTLTVVCISLATTAAWYQQAAPSAELVVLVFGMALAAHISANALNEYFDFRSGLDFLTRRSPFNGGSGTLVAQPNQAPLALGLGILSLILVCAAGLWLSALQSWHLLWLGIPGVALIYTYTQYLNKHPLLCLIAPGLGFGGFMTLGAYWVLAGQVDAMALSLATLLALLISNLLLLNQFPDVEADRQVGRRHLPIVLGRTGSAVVFTVILAATYLLLVVFVWQGWLPRQSLLALFSLPLVWPLVRKLFRYAEQVEHLTPVLALNTILTHVLPALLLLGLVWAGFSPATDV
ncbi:prenyltransferase [Kineobactrum salinum]|uniref:Prenyltransferase n=1 Tax=Kineobactrum salinum TaxID=2708301 RepID=A0A6C0U944_9GAMM|nr:prenyltransferase [Kineobactrum salinum]